jgi:hypothetical protein
MPYNLENRISIEDQNTTETIEIEDWTESTYFKMYVADGLEI